MFWFRWNRLSGSYVALDLDQPVVVAPVVVLDPVLVVAGHEVDVAARLGVRRGRVVVVAHPRGVRLVVGGVRPHAGDHGGEVRVAVGEGGRVGATRWQAPLIG